MNGIQAYSSNGNNGLHGHDPRARPGQNTFITTDVYLKDSSAKFGDNVDVRSELILIPNQRLNNLPVVASQLIDSRRIQNPPVLQGGLPRSTISRRIALYCGVILLIIVLVVAITVVLKKDDKIGDFVSRKQWNARSPTCDVGSLGIVPTLVIIHHTVTSDCTTFEECVRLIRYMQQDHINIDYCDIAYNFLVAGDGRIYEGRGYDKIGAHTRTYNYRTLGIAFIGDFTAVHPSDQQTRRALDFMEEAANLGHLTKDFKVCGANQVQSNNSPGDKLIEDMKHWPRYTADPKKWLNKGQV